MWTHGLNEQGLKVEHLWESYWSDRFISSAGDRIADEQDYEYRLEVLVLRLGDFEYIRIVVLLGAYICCEP